MFIVVGAGVPLSVSSFYIQAVEAIAIANIAFYCGKKRSLEASSQ